MNPNRQIQSGHSSGAVQHINTHQAEIKKTENELVEINQRLERLSRKLKNMRKHTVLSVSDHAIVRYLERVKGMNINDVRREIVTKEIENYYRTLGDGQFPLQQDSMVVAVIKEGTIITILK